jgi:putative phosphoesterase
MTTEHRLGLISDTHGQLRPEAVAALAGVEGILHADDVGGPEVLEQLRRIAPVTAVRGNVDGGAWCRELPTTERLVVGGLQLALIHDIADYRAPRAPEPPDQIVVYGHSHKPALERRDGVLFVNPGAAGPRRFSLPVCLARLTIRDHEATVEHLPLDVRAPRGC